ncbi:hypothetical protein PRIPAC_85337, partial [Pristionchus pacificus]|uniref:Uncharacterized protein n=1 Tax=Pristionchus pacificus TaxID=54126 RepID=A0A2A6CEF0_PRIPA
MNYLQADALFLSLFEAHQESAEGVITIENLTEEEKDITQGHLSSLMHNAGMCYSPMIVGSKKKGLELLSGLVVFRLEVLPVLVQFVENSFWWKHYVVRFCFKEQSLLRCFKWYDKNPISYYGREIE